MLKTPLLLLPSFISCKILGCLIVTADRRTQKPKISIIGVPCFIIASLGVATSCHDFFRLINWEDNSIPFIMNIIALGVHILGCISCMILACMKAHQLHHCISTAIKLTERGKCLSKGLKLNRGRCINIYLVLTLYVLIGMRTAVFFTFPTDQPLWYSVPILWSGMVPTAVESLFVGLAVLHKETLAAVNGVFEEITRGYLPEDQFAKGVRFISEAPAKISEQERAQSIKLILRLCVRLEKSADMLNETFGRILLLGMVFCRVQIINSLYVSVRNVLYQEPFLIEMLTFLKLSTRVLTLVVVTEGLLDQERKLARVIGQVDPSNWDNKAYEQVLQRQVTSLTPKFTTSGVFTLDYQFLQEIVSTTTTYLIVLVQFQLWKI